MGWSAASSLPLRRILADQPEPECNKRSSAGANSTRKNTSVQTLPHGIPLVHFVSPRHTGRQSVYITYRLRCRVAWERNNHPDKVAILSIRMAFCSGGERNMPTIVRTNSN